MRSAIFVLTLLQIGTFSGVARTQSGDTFDEVPTYYSGGVLNYPAGVRGIAMGTSGTASLDRFGTGRLNPAGLAWAGGVSAQASQVDWMPNMEYRDVTISGGVAPVAGALSGWQFGGALSYTDMHWDNVPQRTIFLPEGTGTTFDPSSYVVTGAGAVGYESRRVVVGGGVALKYLHDDLGDSEATAWAVDLGIIAGFPLEIGGGFARPRVGATVTNLSSGIEFGDREADIPGETRLALGVDLGTPATTIGSGAWARTIPILAASLDVDRATDRNRLETHRTWAVGFELSLIDMIHARVGSGERIFGFAAEATTYGLGLGWEVGSFFARFDYARVSPDFEVDIFDESGRDVFGLVVGARL